MHTNTTKITVFAILCLVLSSCMSNRVTYKGRDVVDPNLRAMIITLNTSEITFGAITRFLIAADESGSIDPNVLNFYAEGVAKEFVTAVKRAKNALQTAVEVESDESMSKLHGHLVIIQSILTEIVSIARSNGW